MGLKFNTKYLADFIQEEEYNNIFPQVVSAHNSLHEKKGAGNEFLGWLDLPEKFCKDEFARIKNAAAKIQQSSDVLVVIGIGGSYLGARAVIEAVGSAHYNSCCKSTPQIYFAGNSVSSSSLADIISICEGKDFSVNMISKSGTTTEPAIAFRLLKKMLEEKYGNEAAKERIFVTTDAQKGTLKQLSDKQGYETFVVPDDVGGRFSVLTAVGLLPIATAGIDIDALMSGAKKAMDDYAVCTKDNACYRYAMVRNILHRKGKAVELLACFEPDFSLMNEWFKQLFGESEGKDQKGIFPASVVFSTDLHSMGQFVQDGARVMFETMIDVKNARADIIIDKADIDLDGLNFLAGRCVSDVNKKAMLGTILAHAMGGVPVSVIEINDLSAYSLGQLIYFFEKACAISGYMLGVNPFDQPGVEDYKRNMFALLDKPGYQDQKAELETLLA